MVYEDVGENVGNVLAFEHAGHGHDQSEVLRRERLLVVGQPALGRRNLRLVKIVGGHLGPQLCGVNSGRHVLNFSAPPLRGAIEKPGGCQEKKRKLSVRNRR